MKLILSRPIVFFDIEATGLNIISDRIVELCYLKIYPDGKEECNTFRFNPEIPISEEATAVNGIRNEDVKNCPTFKDKVHVVENIFLGCDIAGFNSNFFDIPLLVEEFIRAGVNFDMSKTKFIDVQNIYHKMEKRTLSAAYKFYCNKELENAHTAEADTRATYEVLQAQLDTYVNDLDNDVDFLSNFSRRGNNVDLAGRIVYNEQGVEIINFGKYKGRPVSEVLQKDPGYFSWIMQGEFTQNTKQTFLRLKLREGLNNK